jgi:hypothetical protein
VKLRVMHFNHPTDLLHRYPRKDGSLSEEYSDFPPIRERKSSPDPPIASVTSLSCHHSLAVQRSEPRSSSEVRSPPRNKGLGQKNILNAIRVKVCVKTQSFRRYPIELWYVRLGEPQNPHRSEAWTLRLLMNTLGKGNTVLSKLIWIG